MTSGTARNHAADSWPVDQSSSDNISTRSSAHGHNLICSGLVWTGQAPACTFEIRPWWSVVPRVDLQQVKACLHNTTVECCLPMCTCDVVSVHSPLMLSQHPQHHAPLPQHSHHPTPNNHTCQLQPQLQRHALRHRVPIAAHHKQSLSQTPRPETQPVDLSDFTREPNQNMVMDSVLKMMNYVLKMMYSRLPGLPDRAGRLR